MDRVALSIPRLALVVLLVAVIACVAGEGRALAETTGLGDTTTDAWSTESTSGDSGLAETTTNDGTSSAETTTDSTSTTDGTSTTGTTTSGSDGTSTTGTTTDGTSTIDGTSTTGTKTSGSDGTSTTGATTDSTSTADGSSTAGGASTGAGSDGSSTSTGNATTDATTTQGSSNDGALTGAGETVPIPQDVVDALLAEIQALGDDATPAELELATLLQAGGVGGVDDITALADYLIQNDSLALLDLVADTLLNSGELSAAQALVPQLLDAGLVDSAVGIVEQVIAEGDVSGLLPVLQDVFDALAASGQAEQIGAIATQLFTPQAFQALLADPTDTTLLSGLLDSLVQSGQAGVLGDVVPGLVDQLLADGHLQQVVALISAVADSGALTAVPGLLNLLLTPQLFQALLADPANLDMVVDLLSSVVQGLVAVSPYLSDLTEIL